MLCGLLVNETGPALILVCVGTGFAVAVIFCAGAKEGICTGSVFCGAGADFELGGRLKASRSFWLIPTISSEASPDWGAIGPPFLSVLTKESAIVLIAFVFSLIIFLPAGVRWAEFYN